MPPNPLLFFSLPFGLLLALNVLELRQPRLGRRYFGVALGVMALFWLAVVANHFVFTRVAGFVAVVGLGALLIDRYLAQDRPQGGAGHQSC